MAKNKSTDKPIEQLSGDLFQIGPYVEGLTAFIRQCDTPMTIALQGSWGSGKTSIMKMIAQAMRGSAICVEFNTWQYSQFSLGEHLPVVFYESLVEKLIMHDKDGETSNELKELKEGCKRAARTLVKLGASLVGMDDPLSIITEGMDKKEPSIVETVESLRRDFEALVQKQCAKEKVDRAVFFVDDLDRLPPERAVELMEVLKIAVECDRCVFVLAIDYDVVLRGVKAKYGTDFADSKGRSFFDKLIQIPVTMPVEQYRISGYVRELLDGLCEGTGKELFATGEELSAAVDFVELAVGRNPRSIKRLLNTYDLSLYMLRGRKETVPLMVKELLFAVQCLQAGFESVYRYFCRVVTDSDDLLTFFRWFEEGDNMTSLKQAMDDDPVLAQQLALDPYTPEELSKLGSFIRRLEWLTRSNEAIHILHPDQARRRSDTDWAQEPAIFVGGSSGMLLLQWEELQEAAALSAATALGKLAGRRWDRVPAELRYQVLDQFLLNLCAFSEANPTLSAEDKCYMARRMTTEDLARQGSYFNESAILSLIARELAWGDDNSLMEALPRAAADPETFVRRCWDMIWTDGASSGVSADEARDSLIQRLKAFS